MSSRVAIISVYFGSFPKYFDLFKKTASFNKDYDWFIFTDQVSECKKENNINFIPYDLHELNRSLSYLFGTNIKITQIHKICDVKPLFAKLFESYLSEYDWWGWTDLDLLNGNFNKFINNEILDEYGAIGAFPRSVHPNKRSLNGSFMLFSMKLKNLYEQITDYAMMLNTDSPNGRKGCYYIDEIYFYDLLVSNGVKLYPSDQHKIEVIKYGKTKLPALWKDGNISTHGYETVIYHFPKSYKILLKDGAMEVVSKY